MWGQVTELNNRVWEGHSHTFEDTTHVIAGAGIGLLFCSTVRDRRTPIGLALIALSALLHLYAYLAKPVGIATV